MSSIVILLTKEKIPGIPESSQVIQADGFSSTFQYLEALEVARKIFTKFLILVEGTERKDTHVTIYLEPDAYHFGIVLALRTAMQCEPRLVVIHRGEHIDLLDFTDPFTYWQPYDRPQQEYRQTNPDGGEILHPLQPENGQA